MQKPKIILEDKIRKDYINRINKVMDYIDRNISEKLSLDILSKIANFSSYHFHRIFNLVIGENLNKYIQRVRLSKSAYLLRYSPQMSITDIALESGFSSSSNFTRSFNNYFKCNPSDFRKNKIQDKESIINKINYKLIKDFDDIKNIPEYKKKFNVFVNTLPDFEVAYIRVIGLNKNKIINTFDKLYKWAKANNIFDSNTKMLGIAHDNPETTQIEKIRYDICITLPKPFNTNHSINIQSIPSKGDYAICNISIEIENFSEIFNEAVNYIYGYWIPYNGYLPSDYKPPIEIYYNNLKESTRIIMDFCVPIKPYDLL